MLKKHCVQPTGCLLHRGVATMDTWVPEVLTLWSTCSQDNVHLTLSLMGIDQTGESGVSFEWFSRLYTVFRKAASTNPAFVKDRKTHRVSYYQQPSGVVTDYVSQHSPTTQNQTILRQWTLQSPERPGMRINATLYYETRLVCSQNETTYDAIRLLECWNYQYKDHFRYSFRKLVTGRDKETACSTSPVFRVQVTTTSADHVVSLVHKACDLLGRFNTTDKTWSKLHETLHILPGGPADSVTARYLL